MTTQFHSMYALINSIAVLFIFADNSCICSILSSLC